MIIKENLDKFFPNILAETSPTFVEFFYTFLQFLEDTNNPDVQSRINTQFLKEEYLENIKFEYARDIPFSNSRYKLSDNEIRSLLNDVINLNKTKGTIDSIEYLFRVLFHSTIDVEFGRLGDYIEYKPQDVKITITDRGDNPSEFDYKLLSRQPFYINGDELKTGYLVTYFKNFNNNSNHAWVVSDDKIADGDTLFLYNLEQSITVNETNRLNLDGWLDKNQRWKGKDDFYVVDEINHRVYDTFYKEINGWDKVTPIDEFEVDDVNKFRFSFINGKIELYQTGTPTEYQTFDRIITANKDGVLYTAKITFTTSENGISNLKVNNVFDAKKQQMLQNSRNITVSASDFLDYQGNVAISSTVLYNVAQLIAAFSIFLKTDVNQDAYMDILRSTVIPAGYRLIHIFYAYNAMLDNIAKTFPVNEFYSYTNTVTYQSASNWYQDTYYKTKDNKYNYNISVYDKHSANPLPPMLLDDEEFINSPWFKAFYGTLEKCLMPAHVRIMDDINYPELYYSETIYSETMPSVSPHIHYTGDNPKYPAPSFTDFWENCGALDVDGKVYRIDTYNNLTFEQFSNDNRRTDLVYTTNVISNLKYIDNPSVGFDDQNSKLLTLISVYNKADQNFDLVKDILNVAIDDVKLPSWYRLEFLNQMVVDDNSNEPLRFNTWIPTYNNKKVLTINKPFDVLLDVELSSIHKYDIEAFNSYSIDTFNSNTVRLSDLAFISPSIKINNLSLSRNDTSLIGLDRSIVKKKTKYNNYTFYPYTTFNDVLGGSIDNVNMPLGLNHVNLEVIIGDVEKNDPLCFVATVPSYVKRFIQTQNRPYDVLNSVDVTYVDHYDIEAFNSYSIDTFNSNTVRLSDLSFISPSIKINNLSLGRNNTSLIGLDRSIVKKKTKYNNYTFYPYTTFNDVLGGGIDNVNMLLGLNLEDIIGDVEKNDPLCFVATAPSYVKRFIQTQNRPYDVLNSVDVYDVSFYFVETFNAIEIERFDSAFERLSDLMSIEYQRGQINIKSTVTPDYDCPALRSKLNYNQLIDDFLMFNVNSNVELINSVKCVGEENTNNATYQINYKQNVQDFEVINTKTIRQIQNSSFVSLYDVDFYNQEFYNVLIEYK